MTIIYRKQKKKTKNETPKIKQGLKPNEPIIPPARWQHMTYKVGRGGVPDVPLTAKFVVQNLSQIFPFFECNRLLH